MKEGKKELRAMKLLEITGDISALTVASLKKAYRDKMMKAHPDKGGTNKDAANAGKAYDLLLGWIKSHVDDAEKERQRMIVRTQRSNIFNYGRELGLDCCVWCHKKMHRSRSVVGTYKTGSPVDSYAESGAVWASNRLTGFDGNGVFCSKACAVEYALSETWYLVDPFPPPVKIKNSIPKGADFTFNEKYRDRPNLYRCAIGTGRKQGERPITHKEIDANSMVKHLGVELMLDLINDD